ERDDLALRPLVRLEPSRRHRPVGERRRDGREHDHDQREREPHHLPPLHDFTSFSSTRILQALAARCWLLLSFSSTKSFLTSLSLRQRLMIDGDFASNAPTS